MFAFFCTLLDERSVVDKHRFDMAVKFGVFAYEDQSKPPLLYWLLSFNKKNYKARFITNSSSFSTTMLSMIQSCFCYAFMCVCLLMSYGHLLGMGCLLGLVCGV